MPITIFFCYAHEDEVLLNQLKSHLKPLQRQGLIDLWHDRDISAGSEWEKEIDKHLNTAQIILLLVSPDFMASDYCYSRELRQALERHKRKEACVIPVILRSVYWQGILGNLQALPTDAKPIVSSSWHNIDDAFFNVTEGIRKVALAMMKRSSYPATEPKPASYVPQQTHKSNPEPQYGQMRMAAQMPLNSPPSRASQQPSQPPSRRKYFFFISIGLSLLLVLFSLLFAHIHLMELSILLLVLLVINANAYRTFIK